MTILDKGWTTASDLTLGLFLVLLNLLALTLNPYVFLIHKLYTHNPIPLLFKTFALVDFVTALIYPTLIIPRIFTSDDSKWFSKQEQHAIDEYRSASTIL